MTNAFRCCWALPLVAGAMLLAVACGSSDSTGGIASGAGGRPLIACTGSGSCAPPVPYCDTTSSVCVECLGNPNCAGTQRPVCNVVTHACAECGADTDCTGGGGRLGGGGGPYCDVAAGRCVACVTDANCGNAALKCNTLSHTCVTRCQTSADCAVPTPYCDTASSLCVECLGDPNCTRDPRNPACSQTTHACVECANDTNCTALGGRTHCDTTTSRCVACLANTDCSAGLTCTNGRCTGCRAGLTSCVPFAGGGGGITVCVDTKSNPNDCGACGNQQTQANICAAGQECQGGICQPSSTGCAAPTPDACPMDGGRGGGRVACVDRQTDPLNCGECGNACADNQSCVTGHCQG